MRRARGAILLGVLGLSACTHVRPPPPEAPVAPPPAARYEVVAGRTSEWVAQLRVTPPTAAPIVSEGRAPTLDLERLAAQGYVQIGLAHLPGGDLDRVRAEALRLGRAAQAEQLLLYPPSTTDGEWTAAYFVRLQLPFGAEFRDLTDSERATLGVEGVRLGLVVGGTPAALANLRSGDIVLRFDRTPLHDRAEFQALLQSHQGRRVRLTIRRDDAVFERVVRLGRLAESGG